ncbi:MAG: DUF1292 domain-containing protein [Oscillospiraceae bacterium]|nr:DUF1292 domain-containing protein [Oscillospiraceae bacterium]
MDDEFGASYITIEDDDGNEFELEHLGTLEFEGEEYMVFLPADMDEDDPDFGFIILQVVEENGEEQFASVDDEEKLQRIYEYYMEMVFSDEEEEETPAD